MLPHARYEKLIKEFQFKLISMFFYVNWFHLNSNMENKIFLPLIIKWKKKLFEKICFKHIDTPFFTRSKTFTFKDDEKNWCQFCHHHFYYYSLTPLLLLRLPLDKQDNKKISIIRNFLTWQHWQSIKVTSGWHFLYL
jgi:hypothetical protein